MNADKMLEQAKASPDKRGLEAYSGTVLELRRKDYSYRDIAEFLNQRGVQTDHTAVYRLVARATPFLDHDEGRVLIGDVAYEYKEDRPLRPFSVGTYIGAPKPIQCILLTTHKRVSSHWCEAQFELDAIPNDAWREKFCEVFDLTWNPKVPGYLKGRFDLVIKIEAKVMAMVCPEYNLENYLPKLGSAVRKTTEFFANDKSSLERDRRMRAERNANILEQHVVSPGESNEDVCEDVLKWHRERAKELNARFLKMRMDDL